jgi:ornithine--oxo-acid transaminase
MDTRFPTGTVPVIGASAQPPNGASDRPLNGTSTVPTAIARERRYAARNYDPLPVVLAHGDGCWLWDEHGRRYLDMMSAYSAVSHGHAHPRIVRALVEQAQRLAVTSRVFHNELLPALLKRLTEVTGLERALPANGGAEAVETALKAARKWGHKIKGIPADSAEVIVCAGNFHGRSITIVGFSSEPQYRDGFGPFAPGFKSVPYGDPDALARAIGPNTAAFLVEPIQGEAGIIVPPAGYLAQCARICRDNNVLLICDEIQTGMGRTGKFLACEHEHVRPDGVILGKALGGGLLPVSALVGTEDLMQVFSPGDHGSTFGGNPLASAVALTALDVLFEEGLIARAAEQGAYLLDRLHTVKSPLIKEVRGKGLFIGVEVDRDRITARDVVDRLLARGILSKDTHGTVVRFAPPLTIDRETLDWAVEEVRAVFVELGGGLRRAA